MYFLYLDVLLVAVLPAIELFSPWLRYICNNTKFYRG